LALPNYAYYFFNEIYKERMGKYIFPPYREIGTEEFDEIILKERSAIGPLATLLVK
jgi:hypothetical protein